MQTIHVKHLTKQYETYRKTPGIKGTLRSLVHRDLQLTHAIRDISFDVGEGEELKAFTSAGFLGSEFGPFNVPFPDAAKDVVTPPGGMSPSRFENRDKFYRRLVEASPVGQLGSTHQRESLLRSLDNAHRLLADARRGSRDVPELTLDVQGISCAACVWLIERVFQQLPGAREIIVNAQYGSMRLRWVSGQFSAPEFARRLQTFGYLAGPAGEVADDSEARQWPSADERWAHGWCYRVHKYYASADGTKDLFGIRWAAPDGGEGWL